MGSVSATAAADDTPRSDSTAIAPSARPAAGPEIPAAGGSRPVSGTDLSAGPQGAKKDGIWSVVAPEVVLGNTVTDADGDRCTLTFEVYTVDANGVPKDQVDISDENPYDVKVSGYVASGDRAQVTIAYGLLKPGVDYAFRTSAFDGTLYETDWTEWERFRIDPYVTFPAPQSSSTIDSVAQEEREIFRSDPGGVMAAKGLSALDKRTCSAVGAKGNKLCMEFRPPSKQEKQAASSIRSGPDDGDLLPWCTNKEQGHDYINRTSACLKDLGTADLIFVSSDRGDPPIGTASFYFEQRIKAYPTKSESGSDFAEFDQQLIVIPHHIDQALKGVNLFWDVGTSCESCDVSRVQWQTYRGSTDDGHFASGEEGIENAQTANTTTKWTGTGKEVIDLSWTVKAQVGVGEAMTASGDFGSSGTPDRRELAPRCDDIVGGVSPGCVLPAFAPTYTVDTNLYPAAGAYYWLMQQKMPDHPGTGDEPLHYLGPDTTVTNPSTGKPWTANNSRGKVCPSSWEAHPSDASLGTLSCDEFAMASTHESGGFPGGPHQVTSGKECAQLYTDKMGSGGNFGIFADTREATEGPTWSEDCGRAAIPDVQNSGAFKKLPAPSWRMLDNDAFFVSNPGFEHCTSAESTCVWREIG